MLDNTSRYKLDWDNKQSAGFVYNRSHPYMPYEFNDINLIQISFDFVDLNYNIQTPGRNTYTTLEEDKDNKGTTTFIQSHTMTADEEAICEQAAKDIIIPDDILEPIYKRIASSYLKATEPLTGFLSNKLTPEEQTESKAYRNLQYDIIQDPLGIQQPEPLTAVMESALRKFGLEIVIPPTW